MPDEVQLSEDEVGRRIVAGMSLVHDLFNELNTLFRLIVQGLNASDADIQSFSGKGFILPKARRRSVVADRFLKNDMGITAEIGVVGSDEPDDTADDEEDIDDGESENDKVQLTITPESQFLGVRAIVFDPNAAKQNDFSPSIVAAVFTNLSRTPTSKKAQQQGEQQTTFKLKRAALKRLTKECSPSFTEGSQISCRLTGARLGATIASVTVKPLAAFNSEDAVNSFVGQLVEMIEGA